jgi:hypothetical protein
VYAKREPMEQRNRNHIEMPGALQIVNLNIKTAKNPTNVHPIDSAIYV